MYFFFQIFLANECPQNEYSSITLFFYICNTFFICTINDSISLFPLFPHSNIYFLSQYYQITFGSLNIRGVFFIISSLCIQSLLQVTFHSCLPGKLKFNLQNFVSSCLKSFLKYTLFSQDLATDRGSFHFQT